MVAAAPRSACAAALERVRREIEDASTPAPAAAPAQAATRLASALYRRASLTGDWADLAAAELALDGLLDRVGPWPDLCLLRAQVELALHRPAAARVALGLAPGVAESRLGRGLAVDAALQEGRYVEARSGAEALAGAGAGADDLARLAHVEALAGALRRADELYAAAEDELSAKELRAYAWIELERGRLQLAQGRVEDAATHCARAGRAFSGWWLVDVQLAGLYVAQGRPAAAATLYEHVLARVERPEVEQALGDVYTRLGRREEAEQRYARALAGYLDSVARGGVHYLHHLTDFYADVRGDGVGAERWAREDLALRPTAAAHAALARALELQGRDDEAAALRRRAAELAPNAHVHAAGMHAGAGYEP